MRDKREPSRGYGTVFAEGLTITVGNDVELPSVVPVVPLHVEWYYEPYIKATEDEPECPEWLELYNIRTTVATYFSDGKGTGVSVMPAADLTPLLTNAQYIKLVDKFKEQRDDA